MFSKMLRFSIYSVFCLFTAISSVYSHDAVFDKDIKHSHGDKPMHYHRSVFHWDKKDDNGHITFTEHRKTGFDSYHSGPQHDDSVTGYEAIPSDPPQPIEIKKPEEPTPQAQQLVPNNPPPDNSQPPDNDPTQDSPPPRQPVGARQPNNNPPPDNSQPPGNEPPLVLLQL